VETLIRDRAYWRCGSFAAGVDVGTDEGVPVGPGALAGVAVEEAEEVELEGDAGPAAGGAVCDVIGKDAALGASGLVVIALSGFSK
jgi:hypothetical protein